MTLHEATVIILEASGNYTKPEAERAVSITVIGHVETNLHTLLNHIKLWQGIGSAFAFTTEGNTWNIKAVHNGARYEVNGQDFITGLIYVVALILQSK